jgi:putative tricarboxylic transport membrane protein
VNEEHHKPSLDDLEAQAHRPHDAPPPPDARDASDRPAVVAEVSTCIVGLVTVALAVVVFVNARGLRAVNEPLGPAFFPTAVAAGLALVGGWMAFSTRNYLITAFGSIRQWTLDLHHVLGIGMVVVTLVLAALFMPVVGFWLVALVIYTVSAIVLQAPISWRIPAVGAVLAGLIVLIFDRLIDLSLPAGPWGF